MRLLSNAKRMIFVGLCGLWMSLPFTSSFGVDVDNAQTYTGIVDDMIAFITDKQAPTAGTGIDSWDNTQNTASKSDAVAIYRLVTNCHVTVTSTTSQNNQRLSQDLGGTTRERLATYYNLTSDGDGVTSTGFQASEYGSGIGSGNYHYVAGGSTGWETLNGLTGSQFLGTSKTITHVYNDGAVLLTLTVRGLNGEDYGSSSDNTEAPDPGSFTTTVAIRGATVTH